MDYNIRVVNVDIKVSIGLINLDFFFLKLKKLSNSNKTIIFPLNNQSTFSLESFLILVIDSCHSIKYLSYNSWIIFFESKNMRLQPTYKAS